VIISCQINTKFGLSFQIHIFKEAKTPIANLQSTAIENTFDIPDLKQATSSRGRKILNGASTIELTSNGTKTPSKLATHFESPSIAKNTNNNVLMTSSSTMSGGSKKTLRPNNYNANYVVDSDEDVSDHEETKTRRKKRKRN
jgi:hypothetical protein